MYSLKITGLVCCLVIISFGVAHSGSWYIEVVDDTDDEGYYNSIALDSSDYPHISYFDYQDLKYAHWDGSAWVISVVDSDGWVGWFTSLALDSSDYPHISYYSFNDGYLKYAYLDSSSWHITTVEIYIDAYGPTSIALDSTDCPHISYHDWSNGGLRYTYWNGFNWQKTIVDDTEGVGDWNSIALDSSDNPHIAYFANGDLNYAYWNGSSWSITAVDTVGAVGYCTSIALDSMDNPHISYCDETNDDLKYAYWSGSAWSITSVDTTGNVGGDTSIALDSADNPHIAYYDGNPNCDLKYAFWTGSEWSITIVDAAGNIGRDNSIALDSSDCPHISYLDYTDYLHGKLKYAWYVPSLVINLTSFTATTRNDNVSLNWQVETPEDEQIAGFNLYRWEVDNNVSTEVNNVNCTWTQVNPSLITGDNPYTYTDSSVDSGKCYEYRLEALLTDESAQTLGTCQATTEKPTSFAITKLYPNPASDVLNITLTLPQTGELSLELYDLSGRMVLEKQIKVSEPNKMSAVLDVSCLASGVYTLRATFNGVEESARCVVAR